jgi:hypothetical protein
MRKKSPVIRLLIVGIALAVVFWFFPLGELFAL